MLTMPPEIQQQYLAALRQQALPAACEASSLKWLRYYLDFCHKYGHPPASRDSLPRVLDKLREKRQAPAQQAINTAVEFACVNKRASAHSFRRAFPPRRGGATVLFMIF